MGWLSTPGTERKGMFWFMVSEMGVHDARPHFLWDCDEEMHCGKEDAHLRTAKKQIEEGTRVCISSMGALLPKTQLLSTGPHLLMVAPIGGPGQFFSKWSPGAYLSQPQLS